ncbi:MAG: C25 family cysteine peptidase [Anaerolineae bacterium]|nr:C25 family cysteine peptidase [Anaerolineae bacterium]
MRALIRLVSLVLVVAFAVALAGPAFAQDAAPGSAVALTLESAPYQVLPEGDDAVRLAMDGFQTALIPGYPALPVRVVDVALPPGARAVGVVLQDAQTEPLGEGWSLVRVPPQVSDDGQVAQLELTEAFPESPVMLEGTHAQGGVAFARLHYFPFRYDPRTGALTLTRRVSVSVRYVRAEGPSLPARRDDLQALPLANADQAREWYDADPEAQSASGYLILTSATLAGSQAVQNFAAHKAGLGFSVYIATPSDWAGFPGGDSADKIRNFLINRYATWNLRYLLIIGSASTIPMKTVYPSPTDHGGSWPTPTDAYYADLTGNWDADRDGYYGERGEDAPDFAAELRVGRIPFDSESVVGPILQKTITYANADGDWRRKALLAMAIQDYTSGGAIQTDGGYLGEEMRNRYLNAAGFASYRLYEENPPATSLPHEGALTLANMTSRWAGGYGLVTWWGHGNRYGAYRRLWGGSGTYDTPFITYDNLSGLDDSKPSIVFQNSCLNAQVGYTNLASELLKRGAVATVAGTTVTWYYLCWDAYNDGGNATIAYFFGQNLVSDRDPVGAALADTKALYAQSYVWFTGDMQNLMAINLHGDPSVGLWPAGVTLQRPLSPGWNLISFSNLSTAVPIADAFASIHGFYTKVYAYDPRVPGGPWLRYVPGGNPADNTLTMVDGTHGYWVEITSPCTLTYTSTAASSSASSVPLYAGWNLVAFPRMSPKAANDALASIAAKVLITYSADPAGSGWIRYSPAAPAWANTLTTFQPGVGYWIKVSADTIWTP